MISFVFLAYLKSQKDPKMTNLFFADPTEASQHVERILESVDVERVEMYQLTTTAQKTVVVNWS